jgi:hypothetical protein
MKDHSVVTLIGTPEATVTQLNTKQISPLMTLPDDVLLYIIDFCSADFALLLYSIPYVNNRCYDLTHANEQRFYHRLTVHVMES